MGGAIHNVLEAACHAIRISPDTYEEDGKAVLDDPRYDELARWIAIQARPKLSATLQKQLDRLLALLEKKKLTKAEEALFDIDEDVTLPDDETIVSGLQMYAVKGARRAGIAAARLLGPPFLDALSRELGRLDAITLAHQQKFPVKGAIVASLWRGRTGAKVTHQIVLLDDKSHGLIAKTKGRWTWTQGPRDDILASVPDVQMEPATAAVIGTGGKPAPKTKKEPAPVDTMRQLPGLLVAAAIGPDGRRYVFSTRHCLAEWKSPTDFEFGDHEVRGVKGMHAGKGLVVTWGATVTTWRDGVPTTVSKTKADGAIVRDDSSIVWWHDGDIHIAKTKKTVRGWKGQRVSFDRPRDRLVVGSKKGVRGIDLGSGKIVFEHAFEASDHAISLDGKRIATWQPGAKSKLVLISNLEDGKGLHTVKLDSAHIDDVVFTKDLRTFVRYHKKERVAIFDKDGAKRHRISARDLGTKGNKVDELFPLQRGAIFAFAPYPTAEAFLVDPDERILGQWKLQTVFYTGGKSFLADDGERSLWAHSRDVTRVVSF